MTYEEIFENRSLWDRLERIGERWFRGEGPDFAQKTKLKLLEEVLKSDEEQIEKIRSEGFAFRIHRNLLIDAYRARTRRGIEVPVDDVKDVSARELNPEEGSIDRDAINTVNACIEELNPRYREVIRFLIDHDLATGKSADTGDVAAHFGLKYAEQAAPLLSRARKALSDKLAQAGIDASCLKRLKTLPGNRP